MLPDAGLFRRRVPPLMLRQLVFGGAISLFNIAIHAVLVAWVILAARRAGHAAQWARPFLKLMITAGSAAAALMAGHALEVAVWAAFYVLAEVAPDAQPFYFAFVNYTTLGYGDVVPVERWRVIGPMTAMNGVLLFGLSTAALFEVLRSTGQGIDRPAA
jgi:hypothetical protein